MSKGDVMNWFVSLQNSYVDILTPKVRILGDEAFERLLGNEGRVLMNGIGACIKGAPESSLTPFTMWGHSEKLVVSNLEEGLIRV